MCGLPRAGQYNEQVFKAIDYILDQMSQNGIRVIVALIDYWKKTDGVEQVSHLLPVQYMCAITPHCHNTRFPAKGQGVSADKLHEKAAQMLPVVTKCKR